MHDTEVTWTHSFLETLLKEIPVDAQTLLDVGCGRGIVGALVRIYRNMSRTVGIDGFRPCLEFCKHHKLYDRTYPFYLKHDLPFKDFEFEVVTCIEVIEHLPKEQGVKLLKELERVGQKVIVSTPTRFFEQCDFDGNPLQHHLSVWTAQDFKARKYEIMGHGYFQNKILRYLSALIRRTFPQQTKTFVATKHTFKERVKKRLRNMGEY